MKLLFPPCRIQDPDARLDLRLHILCEGLRLMEPSKRAAGIPWQPMDRDFAREVVDQSAHRVLTGGAIDKYHRAPTGDGWVHLLAEREGSHSLNLLAQLLSAGLRPTESNCSGQTPFMLAALAGNYPGYLAMRRHAERVSARPQLNATDVFGLSALDYAVLGGSFSIAEDLLERGVRPSPSNSHFPGSEQLARCWLGPDRMLTQVIAANTQTGNFIERITRRAQPAAPRC